MSEQNGFATRDAFLKTPVRRFKEVQIEGFGKVRIRSLNELERSTYEASVLDKKGQVSTNRAIDLKCRLIVLAVVDAEGNQLLRNADIPALRQQDSRITSELVDAIREHCGFTQADIEELEKNSGATVAGASP